MDDVATKQALRALEFLSLAQERLVRIANGKSKDVQDDWLHARDYAEVGDVSENGK